MNKYFEASLAGLLVFGLIWLCSPIPKHRQEYEFPNIANNTFITANASNVMCITIPDQTIITSSSTTAIYTLTTH